MRLKVIGISAALLAACGQQAAQNQATANAPEPAAPLNDNAPAAAEEANASVPARPAPLSEPKGPIDPKSVEAAGQVVQSYGALIEQKRWTESWKLWSDPAAAKQFDRNWREFADVHVEIGDLGDTEGAAGSIYTTMPIFFYGKRINGSDYRERAAVILRRVNDVSGSTQAQRRWHIERINFFRI